MNPLRLRCTILLAVVLVNGMVGNVHGAPGLHDSNLRLDTYLTGLSAPTGIRFSGPDEGFVIQKNDGQVLRYDGGALTPVLDLSVQNDSERGLLGIALDPQFTSNGHVYLHSSSTQAVGDSSTTTQWQDNRLQRYRWDGSSLVDGATLHVFGRADGSQSNGPNHNGGPLVFGHDGQLYGATGDLNRHRAEQNNQSAATLSAGTGGIFRLNRDGTVPADNPFSGDFALWYAYGVRNSFGLAVDPATGRLWDTENGPQQYDEVNLVFRGFNSGWRPIMGPDALDPQDAGSDLVTLSAASYSDPEFSFEDTIGITSVGFAHGSILGAGYDDAVLIGNGRFDNGNVYLLRLNPARDGFVLKGALADGVAGPGEADELIFGTDFGIVTDIQMGPDGALYLASLTQGNVYRVAPVPVPAPMVLLGSVIVALGLHGLRRAVPPAPAGT